MLKQTDVAIIGAGPGGYTAAIRLAQLEHSVTVIDNDSVGGVCLHHGCIPTKALIHVAESFHSLAALSKLGINLNNASIDFSKSMAWKNNIVKKLDLGIRYLLKHYKIDLIKANGLFESSNRIALLSNGQPLEYNAVEFKKCIIASGSKEKSLPNIKIDGNFIITSHHALELQKLPSSILIIGGGYIGIELSQMLAKLGVKVTIVEALPTILNLLDDEISKVVHNSLQKLGVAIYTSAKVEEIRILNDGLMTKIQKLDGNVEIFSEKVLVAIGRVPNISKLHLENTKVKTDKDFIIVNNSMQTHDNNIYAIGDCIGGVMLAHKAVFEGKIAAEAIAGKKVAFDNLVPYTIFSDPEAAGVGLNEKDAKAKGINYKTATFSMGALGKAHIMETREGFFKALYNDSSILGIHIVGARASDMIGEAILAIEIGAKVEDLALIIHPHPTLCEGFGELADKILGLPINGL